MFSVIKLPLISKNYYIKNADNKFNYTDSKKNKKDKEQPHQQFICYNYKLGDDNTSYYKFIRIIETSFFILTKCYCRSNNESYNYSYKNDIY